MKGNPGRGYIFPSSVANTGNPVPQQVVSYFEGLEKPETFRGRISIWEIPAGNLEKHVGIRKFVCGKAGAMWEIWFHPDKRVTPPDLEEGEIPTIAEIYFGWISGGYSGKHKKVRTRTNELDKHHGEIQWCDMFAGIIRFSAQYFQDGYFVPGGNSWFPDHKDLV